MYKKWHYKLSQTYSSLLATFDHDVFCSNEQFIPREVDAKAQVQVRFLLVGARVRIDLRWSDHHLGEVFVAIKLAELVGETYFHMSKRVKSARQVKQLLD